MGKKMKSGSLGKALIRDRFGASRSKHTGDSMLHTADIDDGYKWDRLNLTSVTEESSFQEFLNTAQLAGTEFHAEKLNIKFVNPQSGIGLLSDKERSELLTSHKLNQNLLKIPRRPHWDENTTKEELLLKENQEFLEWRRQLALLQEDQGFTLTPYEKNLEFWRQLWRVIERSDVIVQIVDARNPLLFRCQDLEKYVLEVDETKQNMILINKADFLTQEQRRAWYDYFTEQGVKVAFFSALEATESEKKESRERSSSSSTTELFDKEEEEEEEESDSSDSEQTDGEEFNSVHSSKSSSESEYESANESSPEFKSGDVKDSESIEINGTEILTKDRLIELFKSMKKNEKTHTKNVITIGLVGYPNVGKSSTINAILADKKVSVSATPGKTKHFQTLFVDQELLLCDCPGLVMPSFVCTKAEMILHGILPIDQLRDHVPAVTLLGTWIPRHVIEDTYGLMLPLPMDGEDENRPPTSEEILNTYGFNRGFMTQNGQPDNPRSARYVLKDFVNGKLLYCVAPPNVAQEDFHKFPPRRRTVNDRKEIPIRAIRAGRGSNYHHEDLDKAFFRNNSTGIHTRGKVMAPGGQQALGEKPWKKINKHKNKNKHDKSRKVYAHLDWC